MSAAVQTRQTTFADLIGKLDLTYRPIAVADIRTEPLGPEPDRSFVESVREIGLLVPIIVEEIPEAHGGGYTMIDGYRRLRAVMECGQIEIPAAIAPPGSYSLALLTLLANAQRSPNPVAEFYALSGLIEAKTLSETEIARITGMSVQTIRKRMALSNLSREFMGIFEMGELGSAMAERLAKLTPEDQAKCWAVWNTNAGHLTGEDIRRVREADRAQVDTIELPGMPEAAPGEFTPGRLYYEVCLLRADLAVGALDLVEVDQRLAMIETIAGNLRGE